MPLTNFAPVVREVDCVKHKLELYTISTSEMTINNVIEFVNLWVVSSAVSVVPSLLLSLRQALKYYESLPVLSSIIKNAGE